MSRGAPGATRLLRSAFAVALLFFAPAAHAALEPYEESVDPLATTPSTDDGTFGAWHNPAQWGVPERGGFDLALFATGDINDSDVIAWQAGFGRGLGFSVRHRDEFDAYGGVVPRYIPWAVPVLQPGSTSLPSLTEYQIGAGSGNGRHFGGFAYHFSGSGKGAWRRSNYLSFGDISRPFRQLSIGASTRWAPSTGDADAVFDVGFRPDGTSRITLFGDLAMPKAFDWNGSTLGVGASIRPVDGVELSGRWRENDRFQFSAGVTLARFGARATPIYRDRGAATSNPGTHGHLGTWYSFRLSPPLRGLDVERGRMRNRRFIEMDLHGRAVYQSSRWFDTESKPLRDLTEQIRFAKEDPTVGGVAIRLSGFEANAAMMWELRESLLALKRAGKKVLIAADHLDQRSYYLACVADHLVLDPLGGLLMPGVQASRTYMKDLLGKIGLGFDEWRFYKYKSAMETLSRTSFSDADREQFQALVRASYEELAGGIAASGRITRDRLDQLVNEEPYVTASRMKELGLVDALGRWEELESQVKAYGGRGKPRSHAAVAERRWRPDETWGPVPTVALVYLVGECAMDTGIRARTTAPAMKRLRDDRDVRAVVLRVDSPGGDPIASDLVAEETRKLRAAKKPALVSQGRVAGSGGYWISMDGETVATGPFTLTGSIGIIGGWVWNDGFGKKSGLTSDHVQIGKSADLLGGLTVPFLGAQLPERNLDEGERRQIQGVFESLYGSFTSRVATGRGLEEARVRELGEGRIYDGRAAVENRLVDRIATLEETIEAAKLRAGIAPGRRYRVVEIPRRPLFTLPAFFPGVRALLGATDVLRMNSSVPARLYETGVLQRIIDQPGRPLLLTPGSLLPLEEEPIR